MNLDRRADAIERAAQAWAAFYLWAMEQPDAGGSTNRTYTGPVADTILAEAGITFDASPGGYREASDEVVRRGYELAGGKKDLRGRNVGTPELRDEACKLRNEGHTLGIIASKLGVSATTVYRLLRAA